MNESDDEVNDGEEDLTNERDNEPINYFDDSDHSARENNSYSNPMEVD